LPLGMDRSLVPGFRDARWRSILNHRATHWRSRSVGTDPRNEGLSDAPRDPASYLGPGPRSGSLGFVTLAELAPQPPGYLLAVASRDPATYLGPGPQSGPGVS